MLWMQFSSVFVREKARKLKLKVSFFNLPHKSGSHGCAVSSVKRSGTMTASNTGHARPTFEGTTRNSKGNRSCHETILFRSGPLFVGLSWPYSCALGTVRGQLQNVVECDG
jgi:hypothetical protein